MLTKSCSRGFEDRWVVNMSSRDLSIPEKSILSKGLNFVPAPKRIPILHIIAAIKSGLNGLNDDAHIRQKMIGLLMKSKPPPSNILPSERKALRDLRAEPDIMILPADKATVLLDRQDYEERMRTMLSDMSTYRVIQKDPTSSLQRKMNGCGPHKGRAPQRGAWRRSRPLSPEWPAAAPVLAVSETCAWVSEVKARR